MSGLHQDGMDGHAPVELEKKNGTGSQLTSKNQNYLGPRLPVFQKDAASSLLKAPSARFQDKTKNPLRYDCSRSVLRRE